MLSANYMQDTYIHSFGKYWLNSACTTHLFLVFSTSWWEKLDIAPAFTESSGRKFKLSYKLKYNYNCAKYYKRETVGYMIYKNVFQEWSLLRVLLKRIDKLHLSLNVGMQLLVNNNNEII